MKSTASGHVVPHRSARSFARRPVGAGGSPKAAAPGTPEKMLLFHRANGGFSPI